MKTNGSEEFARPSSKAKARMAFSTRMRSALFSLDTLHIQSWVKELGFIISIVYFIKYFFYHGTTATTTGIAEHAADIDGIGRAGVLKDAEHLYILERKHFVQGEIHQYLLYRSHRYVFHCDYRGGCNQVAHNNATVIICEFLVEVAAEDGFRVFVANSIINCLSCIALDIDKKQLGIEEMMDKCIDSREIPLAVICERKLLVHNTGYIHCFTEDVGKENLFFPKTITTVADSMQDSFVY